MGFLLACVFVHHVCALSMEARSQEQLQMIVSCYVGAKN